MIGRIFIGRPLHWLFVLLLVPAGYAAGSAFLHASNFVTWASLLFLATLALILAIWRTSAPSDRLTREPVDEGEIDLREHAD